ncbi:MAG: nucleoside kinase [Oscillospiraceae bacterium]|nr:nucleoside kinase [Oscillospiraceae bacterium]
MAENEDLLRVTVDGEQFSYPRGTTYKEIADGVQAGCDQDILLVERDGILLELQDRLDRSCRLRTVTALDPAGRLAYERGAVFMMLKAFYDTAGRENVEKISVEYPISGGLFVLADGNFSLDQSLLDKVEERMRQLSGQKIPFDRILMSSEDAVDYFKKEGAFDKALLLSYRTSAPVRICRLEDLTDCFYGEMVPDTGYIRTFALTLFESGFVLRLPAENDPGMLSECRPAMKVFRTMQDAANREEALGISDVGELNQVVAAGGTTQIILSCEALMEKELGDIAEEIAGRDNIRFVMIAGPSSSSKTTFSYRLSTQLVAAGIQPHPISLDNYFRNRSEMPRDENGNFNFECLEAIDLEEFNRDMNRLLQGERVDMPVFNFKKGEREYNGDTLQLGDRDILVIEGIHGLNDKLSYSLPQESMYRIYLSCLTTLNLDHHNYISSADVRLLRRIQRDSRTRGYGARETIRMWPSVRAGEENNIFPFMDSADTVFNTSMIYETAMIRPYVEPLLYAVPRDSEEYGEARRLLNFLSYSLPIPDDDLPRISFLREFIGGSSYQVD